MKVASGRRSHDLGRIELGACLADDDGVGPGGVRRSNDGAQVSGVGDVEGRHNQRRLAEKRVQIGRFRRRDDCDDALGVRRKVAHVLCGKHVRPHSGRGGQFGDVAVPFDRLVGDVEVTRQAGGAGEELAHGLRPFDQGLAVP